MPKKKDSKVIAEKNENLATMTKHYHSGWAAGMVEGIDECLGDFRDAWNACEAGPRRATLEAVGLKIRARAERRFPDAFSPKEKT